MGTGYWVLRTKSCGHWVLDWVLGTVGVRGRSPREIYDILVLKMGTGTESYRVHVLSTGREFGGVLESPENTRYWLLASEAVHVLGT